ncbi:12323_t:CDS:2 [Acaulospora colombiana]|uniref:12323_t:CDS:1 n=1 Tax=Acaulospora colombiana TaxID=27376 RepID=A0ACA9LQ59_9GLOM|nr:12323_t:CDS:2 [Acaulospora colombiana]
MSKTFSSKSGNTSASNKNVDSKRAKNVTSKSKKNNVSTKDLSNLEGKNLNNKETVIRSEGEKIETNKSPSNPETNSVTSSHENITIMKSSDDEITDDIDWEPSNSGDSGYSHLKTLKLTPKLSKVEIQNVLESYNDFYEKNYNQINFLLLQDFPSWLDGLGLKPLAPYFANQDWHDIIELTWNDLEILGITNWQLRKRLLRHFFIIRKFLARERGVNLPVVDFSNIKNIKNENDEEENWYGHIDPKVLRDMECFLHSLNDGLGKLCPYFYEMSWQDLCLLTYEDLKELGMDNKYTRNILCTKIKEFKIALQKYLDESKQEKRGENMESSISQKSSETSNIDNVNEENAITHNSPFNAMKLIEDVEILLKNNVTKDAAKIANNINEQDKKDGVNDESASNLTNNSGFIENSLRKNSTPPDKFWAANKDVRKNTVTEPGAKSELDLLNDKKGTKKTSGT